MKPGSFGNAPASGGGSGTELTCTIEGAGVDERLSLEARILEELKSERNEDLRDDFLR